MSTAREVERLRAENDRLRALAAGRAPYAALVRALDMDTRKELIRAVRDGTIEAKIRDEKVVPKWFRTALEQPGPQAEDPRADIFLDSFTLFFKAAVNEGHESALRDGKLHWDPDFTGGFPERQRDPPDAGPDMRFTPNKRHAKMLYTEENDKLLSGGEIAKLRQRAEDAETRVRGFEGQIRDLQRQLNDMRNAQEDGTRTSVQKQPRPEGYVPPGGSETRAQSAAGAKQNGSGGSRAPLASPVKYWKSSTEDVQAGNVVQDVKQGSQRGGPAVSPWVLLVLALVLVVLTAAAVAVRLEYVHVPPAWVDRATELRGAAARAPAALQAHANRFLRPLRALAFEHVRSG
ncbi:unnamed protein product [Pedinophyceae sp. YPF-701]|nr:unnamed protein product [Pedinophyceae sp. YPF-701]